MEVFTEINGENKENDGNYLNNEENGENGPITNKVEDQTGSFHTETTKNDRGESQNSSDDTRNNTGKINILSNIVLHVDKIFDPQESVSEGQPPTKDEPLESSHSGNPNDIDSDSDDDVIKRIKKSNIIDSDSDSHDGTKKEHAKRELFCNEPSESGGDDEQIELAKKRHIRKRIANVIDSDSEEDFTVTPHNKSFNDDVQPVFIANSKGELVPEETPDENVQNTRLKALCDSESEEEYQREPQEDKEGTNIPTNICESAKSRSNTKKHENDKPKMNAKIAAEQKREILSEAQRRVRESDVSLPYHRPKPRTLQEFLEKRPRLSSAMAISENVPPSVGIKMSLRQLEMITKKLEEREKEVEEFYKSESEPEEEEVKTEENVVVETQTNGSCENKNNETNTNNEEVKNVNNGEGTIIDGNTNGEEMKVDNNIEICEETQKVTSQEEIDANEETPTTCIQISNDSLEEDPQNIVANNELTAKPQSESCLNEFEESPKEEESMKTVEESNKIEDNTNEDTEKTNKRESNEFESDKSLEYTFNLDDLEEFDVKQIEEDPKKEDTEEISKTDKLLTKQKLLAKLALTKPKLSGNPDEIIDLEDGIKDRSVSRLMERFVKHACPTNPTKTKIELDVVRVTSGGFLKEHVSMKVDDDEPPVAVEKPGAKLQKLRNVLQEQMEQKRAEQWQQKKIEKDIEEENVEEDEPILDDDEEEALTESSSEEEEEEPVDDVKYVDKPRVKSVFVDDEAEESDVEEEDDIGEDADDENEPESDNEHNDENPDNTEDHDETKQTELTSENKKSLKRIAKAFEDSDDSDADEFVAPKPVTSSGNVKKNSSVEIHSVSTETADDDDFPPPNQPNVFKTPLKETTQSKDYFLLSPVTNLTGLQSFNSATQFLHESPKSPLLPLAEPSPLREPKWKDGLQKKLLFESTTNSSQVVDDDKDIAQICSGSFPKSDNRSTQEIINVCSGQFPSFTLKTSNEISQPQITPIGDDIISETPEILKEPKQQSSVVQLIDTNTDEIKNFDDGEENLISQLLNEEEMENFKKKLDLHSKETPPEKEETEVAEEIEATGCVIDSDEENLMVKKKPKQKLVFSDEDDSDEEIEDCHDEDEEIDLHDTDDDEKIVEYDSEENEVVVDEVKTKVENLKASDFLENEAELSESEWGSADEDENDLDKLEQELGDDDIIDEQKERSNLERLHMRQMLDEDSYNIKLLQEIYLDDGELHGAGRQRQFRWRNIDNTDDENGVRKVDDQEGTSDNEESEENWRRMRRERELFLKKQQSLQTNDSIDSLVSNSQILQLAKVTVIKKQTNTSLEKPPVKMAVQNLPIANKRGSFLARNDQVLNRLAEFTTKINDNATAPKNTKNFVFQTVNEDKTSNLLQVKKRKSQADGTPKVLKKLRLSNLSPATNKGSLSKSERAKKLFSNW